MNNTGKTLSPITISDNAKLTFTGDTNFADTKGFTETPLVLFGKAGTSSIEISEDVKVTFTGNEVSTVLASGTNAVNKVTVNGTLEISNNNANGINGGTLELGDNAVVTANGNEYNGVTAKVITTENSNAELTASSNGMRGLTLNGGSEIKGNANVVATGNNTLQGENICDIEINTKPYNEELMQVEIGGNAYVEAGTMGGYQANVDIANRDKVVVVDGDAATVVVANPTEAQEGNANTTAALFEKNEEGEEAASVSTVEKGVIVLGDQATVYGDVDGKISLPEIENITINKAEGANVSSNTTFDAVAGTTVKNETDEAIKVSTPNGTVTVPANGEVESKPYKPSVSYPTVDPLKTAKTEAASAVANYLKAADYETAEQAEIKTIVDKAKSDIEAAKTADEIKAIEAAAKAQLDKIETAAEKALIKSIGETKLAARSSQVTLKNGKKAVKITWQTVEGEKIQFDGVEIYRSTKRYSGYGKKPIYTSKSERYYNTAIKTGTKYYYKVRGFKYVNDEKVYTEYSLKAWRTVK